MSSVAAHTLATAVVVVHVVFVIFVAAGGPLAFRWPKLAFIHLPAVVWAVYVEWSGAICPLTPLENALRVAAGLEAYAGDFVAEYVFPVLYPDGLPRGAQIFIGFAVLVLNLFAYLLLQKRRTNTVTS